MEVSMGESETKWLVTMPHGTVIVEADSFSVGHSGALILWTTESREGGTCECAYAPGQWLDVERLGEHNEPEGEP